MKDIYKEMVSDIIEDGSDKIQDINFNLGEFNDEELLELDNLELINDGRLENPGENINIVEINQSANGKLYKFYIIPVTDYINKEFAVYIKHKDKNTKGYLFPTFENVYNNRYLDEVVNSGNFRTITTNEFTEEMYNSISEDLECKLYVKFLQLFT